MVVKERNFNMFFWLHNNYNSHVSSYCLLEVTCCYNDLGKLISAQSTAAMVPNSFHLSQTHKIACSSQKIYIFSIFLDLSLMRLSPHRFSQAVNLPNEKLHVELCPNTWDFCNHLRSILHTCPHLKGQRSVFQRITSLCEHSNKMALLVEIPLWHFMEEGLWCITSVMVRCRRNKTFSKTDNHSNWHAK